MEKAHAVTSFVMCRRGSTVGPVFDRPRRLPMGFLRNSHLVVFLFFSFVDRASVMRHNLLGGREQSVMRDKMLIVTADNAVFIRTRCLYSRLCSQMKTWLLFEAVVLTTSLCYF